MTSCIDYEPAPSITCDKPCQRFVLATLIFG